MKKLLLSFAVLAFLCGNVSAQTYANTAASGLSVTNNSALGYQKCIANWDVPTAWWIAPGQTTFTVSMWGAHWSGTAGQPLAGVLIWALDQHSHSNGFWVTNMTLSPATYGVPYPHYAATFQSINFNSGDNITLNFAAYPWVGNSNSIVNTSDGVNTQPTPLYAPLTWYDNYSNSQYSAKALVDPLHGSDSTGLAQTNAFVPFSNSAPFATIAKAISVCESSNAAVFGHADAGGSQVFLTNGLSIWMGGTASVGTNSWQPWVLTNAVPGAFTNGISTWTVGSYGADDRVVIGGLQITNTAGGRFIYNFNYVIFVNDLFNCPQGGATYGYNTTNLYFLSCQITNVGLVIGPYSTYPGEAVLVKDCNFDYYTNYSVKYWTMLGCSRSNTLGGVASMWFDNESTGGPYLLTSNCIVAYNRLYRLGNQSNPGFQYAGNQAVLNNNLWGAAFVDNVFEITNNFSPAGYDFCGDNLTNGFRNNVILWNNLLLGGRVNLAYDEIVCPTNLNGDVGFVCWYARGNVFDQLNLKMDTFTNSGLATSWGGRTNNWAISYSVGWSGNVSEQIAVNGGGGNFQPMFAGLNAANTNELQYPATGTINPANWAGFVNDLANTGSGPALGLGNYHLSETSPAITVGALDPMPFDLDGFWSGYSPAGAFSSANPYPANFFFGQ
jgi:hypothetical protein